MRSLEALSFAVVVSLAAFGCNSSPDPGPEPSPPECTDASKPGCLVASDKQRIVSPAVPDADLNAAISGNTAFALDLYQQLRTEKGNLFYSPFSISEALAMTFAGARGETEKQMAKALHFDLPQAQLHPAFNAIDLALASRGKGASGSDGAGFRLNVSNALWGQTGYTFEAPLLDTLALNYGAGMHVVDFRGAADGSRTIINDWVADRTEDRIKDLMPKDSISSDTRLVLTNTIYFNAAWAAPFESSKTKLAPFTHRDGSKSDVQTMSATQDLAYGAGDDYAAVALPYERGELSMLLILPPQGGLDAFEASLTPARLTSIVDGLAGYSVSITMPRAKIESSFSLAEQLAKLGMTDAFTDSADFSGINGKKDLSISAVVHKAFVTVSETGTEAAAATGVSVGVTSLPPPAEIHLDHPYLFLIRDNATGSILFLGRVEDPAT
jgi:serine protease inhibitor